MRNVFFIFFFACAVAIAGAAFDVYASEPDLENNEQFFDDSLVDHSSDLLPGDYNIVQDMQSTPIPSIDSESESIGEFGSNDNSVNESLDDLFNDLDDSGLDFVTPVPDIDFVEDSEYMDVSPSPSFSLTPSPIPSPLLLFDDDIDLYANYNTYYGSIGSTYLEYMRGFLPKLGFKEHYVASRVSQYDYIFAYGENLSFDGVRFFGSGVTVVTWNTYNNGTYSTGVQSSFTLVPGSYLVYSDLSKVYPSLADTAGFTLRQILILLTMFFLGIIVDHMYQVRKIRRTNIK